MRDIAKANPSHPSSLRIVFSFFQNANTLDQRITTPRTRAQELISDGAIKREELRQKAEAMAKRGRLPPLPPA
jgi:hypothetical protein